MRIHQAGRHQFPVEHRRRLPHIYPKDRWLFLTWCLHGSLPHTLYPPPSKATSAQSFVWMDRFLDTARSGPLYLRKPEIAAVVVAAIRRGEDLGHYRLGSFAVMANHVHLLVWPRENPSRFMQSLKGASAREANRLLGRTGDTFWQAESYDHWVRDETEFRKIVAYIENNPVKAGLVVSPEDFPWSSASASAETSLGTAG